MPPTADPLEVLWTVASLLGLVGAIGVVLYAWGDWRQDRRAPHPDPRERRRRRLVSSTVLRNRAINVFVQAVLVGLGARAMLLPPNPASTDWSTQLAGALVLAMSLAISGGALVDFWGRYRFRQLDREGTRTPAPPKEQTK